MVLKSLRRNLQSAFPRQEYQNPQSSDPIWSMTNLVGINTNQNPQSSYPSHKYTTLETNTNQNPQLLYPKQQYGNVGNNAHQNKIGGGGWNF